MGPSSINPLIFSFPLISLDFFLSLALCSLFSLCVLFLLSVLSLLFQFSVEARNGGLGFAVGKWWLTARLVDSVAWACRSRRGGG